MTPALVAVALSAVGPPPAAGLLFDGSRTSSWPATQAAENTRIGDAPDPAGSGSTVMRLTALDGDVVSGIDADDPLAQLIGPDDLMEPGREVWQRFELYLPSAEVPGRLPRGGWIALQAPAVGAPFGGAPPVSIQAEGRHLVFKTNGHAPRAWNVAWRMPIVRDRWIAFTWHMRLAQDGWVELLVDDRPVQLDPGSGERRARLHVPTLDRTNGVGPWSPRLSASYRKGLAPRITIYARNFKLGTSRTSVEPTAAPD